MLKVYNKSKQYDKDVSIYEALLKEEKEKMLNNELSRLIIAISIEANYATNIENLSVKHMLHGETFKGKERAFPSGYSQIIDRYKR